MCSISAVTICLQTVSSVTAGFAIFSPTGLSLMDSLRHHGAMKLQQISCIKRVRIVTHVFTTVFENTAGAEMCIYK